MKNEGDLGFSDELDAHVVDKSVGTQKSDVNKDVLEPGWLGIETSHRRLFEASQSGWFGPSENASLCFGREYFIVDTHATQDGVIPVRLSFDVRALPVPIVNECTVPTESESGVTKSLSSFQCTAPLPLYAIRSIDVSSLEHQSRLLAMSRNFSNVSFPMEKFQVTEFETSHPSPTDLSTPSEQQWHLPESIDAVHGAIAMSIWAVPKVQPWIEVLRLALSGDTRDAVDATCQLGVPWLKLPWLVNGSNASYQYKHDASDQPDTQIACKPASDEDDMDIRLWRAAITCMQHENQDRVSSASIATRIAERACADTDKNGAESWLNETLRILAAEQSIQCDMSKRHGAGLAIQLVLLRPEPRNFKSWSTSLPGLPPAVWWAAATLCGWQHGYESLDKNFRGDAGLQEFTAVRALAASSSMDEERLLPECQQSPIQQVQKIGRFVLSWCEREVIRKPWQGRAKWYANQLSDRESREAAQVLSRRLSWPCVESWLKLPEGEIATEGNGDISIRGDTIVVENGVRNLQLSDALKPEERIDLEAFRRLLVTGAGFVTDPPESNTQTLWHKIPGLVYRPDFITPSEEIQLIELIDSAPWNNDLVRRVQHYGWRYDYKQRRIDESMHIGPLPDWAQELAHRLVRDGLMRHLADQVIVNEYREKQGISAHSDQPHVFHDEVGMVSLLETWSMVFRRRGDKYKVELPLDKRSVTVLTKEARYEWTHEIPSRKFEYFPDDEGHRKRIKRTRRISLTFRKTRVA